MAQAYYNTGGTSFAPLTANMVGAAPMYEIPNYSSSKSYARICRMPADIGSGKGGLSAIIMGASNFGGTDIPLIKVSFSTRGYSGSGTIPENLVYSYCLGTSSNINFITKLNGSNMELWISAAAYPYPLYLIPFGTDQITFLLDSNTTTAPTGTVHTHTMHSFCTSNNAEVVVSSSQPSNSNAKIWVKV